MHEDWERDDLPKVSQLRRELARVRRAQARRRRIFRMIIALLVLAVIVGAAVIWLPVHRVGDRAMAGTLEQGDVVIALHGGIIQAGDLILFDAPDGNRIVRRVIAVTGDEVNILEDGAVVVNGQPLQEGYAFNVARGDGDFPLPYVVPSSRYFVLSDDRSDALDSRVMDIGSIKSEQILGRVALRLWPLSALSQL